METESSTSAKPDGNNGCPISTLPPDILAKILAYTPIAQWPELEVLDENFRAAVLIAWRQLRSVNIEDHEFPDLLQNLVERSPFLTEVVLERNARLNSDSAQLIAQFENLQSISLGDDTKRFPEAGGMPPMQLENVVEILESTRSRSSLKELRLYDIVHPNTRLDNHTMIMNQFASSFGVNSRGIYLPLKLEKFSYAVSEHSRSAAYDRSPSCMRLDTLDTTRLTELCVGNASIVPDQLTNLIERASKLQRIDFSFSRFCGYDHGQYLQGNKKLLMALASHPNLIAISIHHHGHSYGNDICMGFGAEFVLMLKAIGRRGKLRELVLEEKFASLSAINMDEVCATIHEYIPYLQSIKLCTSRISNESVVKIVSLVDLEEINLCCGKVTANVIMKTAQLPNLKHLVFHGFADADEDSLAGLAAVRGLKELRIENASMISGDVFEKWSDGFASNLEVMMIRQITIHAEEGLVRFLERATRLRLLVLDGRITHQSLKAIAQSGPDLEILGFGSSSYDIPVWHLQEVLDRYPDLARFNVQSVLPEVIVRHLQEIIDRCPKLKDLGGFRLTIRRRLVFPKYRKIDKREMPTLEYRCGQS